MRSFETSRFAPGRKNYNYFERYGSNGSLIFNLERMKELLYFSLEDLEGEQDFRTIMATEGVHDYVANWWPLGHIILYEHEFVHAVVDLLRTTETGAKLHPTPKKTWHENGKIITNGRISQNTEVLTEEIITISQLCGPPNVHVEYHFFNNDKDMLRSIDLLSLRYL